MELEGNFIFTLSSIHPERSLRNHEMLIRNRNSEHFTYLGIIYDRILLCEKMFYPMKPGLTKFLYIIV